jgi:2-keto-4-pentenoate hydratase/2-oxohepta-3-ene-1,7-dioic acid hydratase in catechol pathway
MRLVTFSQGRSRPRAGAMTENGVLDLGAAASRLLGRAPAWARHTLAFLDGGERAREEAADLLRRAEEDPLDEEVRPLAGVRLLAPVPAPRSVRDSMSFERHVVQATRAVGLKRLAGFDAALERRLGPRRSIAGRLNRSFYEQPPYYLSNHQGIVGPDADVRIPPGCKMFDYELEWGVFIGKEGVDIPAGRAHEHIGAYTIFNDFSARDIQLREMRSRLGPSKGKNFDGGNAMGPWLVTPDELPDPYDLEMVARVNGAEWSRASTGEAHWRFDRLIEHVSRSETLRPGDFIGSGTASGERGMGCGLEMGVFLEPGDVVELEVERIGVLRNRVVAAAG